MADYFTYFSLILPLPNEAAQACALDLARQASAVALGDGSLDHLPASLRGVVEDWCFETDAAGSPDGWGLWLHSESGGMDAACAFIQHLLRTFDPQGRVRFEWSHDCSKPRLDAFGGGAALITAQEIKTMSTGEWLHQNAA